MKLHKIRSCLFQKTIVITGASRGIGREIALRCAKDQANLVLIARSGTEPSHKKLHGSLSETKDSVEKLGGQAYVLPLDISKNGMQDHVEEIVSRFGAIDCIINNASAIDISKRTSLKNYDMMMNVNVRGTMNTIESFYEELEKSDLRHVLSISPPLKTLDLKWLHPHPPYSTSKYAMSMITLGYSDIFRANSIWPKKLIRTAATKMLEEKTNIPAFSKGLDPSVFANTVHNIICSDLSGFSGLDDEIEPVNENGIDDIFI